MFHSVRDLSQAPPRAEHGVRGIRSQEVRISSFRVHGSRFLHVKADTRWFS